MSTGSKRKTAKALSLIVTAAGIVVIIGWIFNIALLKSILTGWVSMKFDSAIAFVLSGISLYFIARALEGEFDKAQVVLSVTSLIIMLLIGILFFSMILNIHTGAEELFMKDTNSAKTIVPGRPSVLTMINFILIALGGIFTMFNSPRLRTQLKVIGLIVAAVGLLAVVGYIINAPALYYFIKGVNSPMACHTAVLFVLLGTGLLCL